MVAKKVNYVWHKQSMDPHCETIDCSIYDPIKDFRRDRTGFYVLIRPDYAHKTIEVAICDKRHVIVKVFRGKRSVDIFEEIFRYEKRHRKLWFSDKAHAAYLGKELKKVDVAMASGKQDYIQE